MNEEEKAKELQPSNDKQMDIVKESMTEEVDVLFKLLSIEENRNDCMEGYPCCGESNDCLDIDISLKEICEERLSTLELSDPRKTILESRRF
jgi:hypothetical protein